MSLEGIAAKIAFSTLNPAIARYLKARTATLRYWVQARRCRNGYKKFGQNYSQSLLFVAGLPKSGTSWLERMLLFYPGFHGLMIPEAIKYELATGGSHDFELPSNTFERTKKMLVVMKLHIPGSTGNIALLKKAGLRYVVLYRDPRDVAVSHCYYVRRTPWHPEHPLYSSLSLKEGLLEFSTTLLPRFVRWIRSWRENGDSKYRLEITYESLLADTTGVMRDVAGHFGLDQTPLTIREVVDKNSFKRLSRGRERGEDSAQSFFRKGVKGDWVNHFDKEVSDRFKLEIGEFLIELGYEKDMNW